MVELRLSLGRISSSKRTFLTRPSRCVEHFQGEFQDLSGSLAPSLYLYLKKIFIKTRVSFNLTFGKSM